MLDPFARANIIYTKHARTRMQERNVTEAQVEAAVLEPDRVDYGDEGELIASKQFGRRRIRVVYLSLPEAIKVITVTAE